MQEPEWFGPMDKLSWRVGQITELFDYLLAFGVVLLVLAMVALVIQLVGLRQLLRAEKAKRKHSTPNTSFVTKKPPTTQFRRTALHTAPVRRKPL